jgi:hypothetical protein
MKGKASKPSTTKDTVSNTVPSIRVLKSASCKSLSGRSTLGYEIGAEKSGEIHLRIRTNSGHGCFGREWVSLRALQQALAKTPEPITSGSLHKVFAGKSQNTSGFVLAALFHEGLLKPLGDTRGYEPTDGTEFMREVKRLLERPPTQANVDTVKAPAKKADAPMPSAKKAVSTSKAKTVRK